MRKVDPRFPSEEFADITAALARVLMNGLVDILHGSESRLCRKHAAFGPNSGIRLCVGFPPKAAAPS